MASLSSFYVSKFFYFLTLPCIVKEMCVATEGQEGGQYGFFVHPGETVTLPLKYQCFQSPEAATESENIIVEDGPKHKASGKKCIKVI